MAKLREHVVDAKAADACRSRDKRAALVARLNAVLAQRGAESKSMVASYVEENIVSAAAEGQLCHESQLHCKIEDVANFTRRHVEHLIAAEVGSRSSANYDGHCSGLTLLVTRMVTHCFHNAQSDFRMAAADMSGILHISMAEWARVLRVGQTTWHAAKREFEDKMLDCHGPSLASGREGVAKLHDGHVSEPNCLFERLGGAYPVAFLIDGIVEHLLQDKRAGSCCHSEAVLKYSLFEVMCRAMGGPSLAVTHLLHPQHILAQRQIPWLLSAVKEVSDRFGLKSYQFDLLKCFGDVRSIITGQHHTIERSHMESKGSLSSQEQAKHCQCEAGKTFNPERIALKKQKVKQILSKAASNFIDMLTTSANHSSWQVLRYTEVDKHVEAAVASAHSAAGSAELTMTMLRQMAKQAFQVAIAHAQIPSSSNQEQDKVRSEVSSNVLKTSHQMSFSVINDLIAKERRRLDQTIASRRTQMVSQEINATVSEAREKMGSDDGLEGLKLKMRSALKKTALEGHLGSSLSSKHKTREKPEIEK
jgi:hypothetical protein